MANLFQAAGASDSKPTRYAPIYINRMNRGLVTQRSPLRDPSPALIDRYYGGTPDALLDGENIELTNRLTLARRPGTSLYCNQTISTAVNSFYSFKRFSTNTETITLMADTDRILYTFSALTLSPIWKKSAAANQGNTTFLGVANQLYMGNGADQTAWPGPEFTLSATITATSLTDNVAAYTAVNTFLAGNYVTVVGATNDAVFNITNQPIVSASSTDFTVAITNANIAGAADTGTAVATSVRNWGIGLAGTTGTSAYAGSGASSASGGSSGYQRIDTSGFDEDGNPVNYFYPVPTTSVNGGGGTGGAWSSLSNVTSQPNYIQNTYQYGRTYASSVLTVGQITPKLQTTGYGFTIPTTATIDGIYVLVFRDQAPPFSTPKVRDSTVFLLKGGVQAGTDHADVTYDWGSAPGAAYGSSTDLWGTTWTPAEINASDFGLQIQGVASGGSTTAKISMMTILVYYTIDATPAWTSASNITGAPDAAYAETTASQGLQTGTILATNYGFSITSTVVGISVDVTGHVDSGTGPPQLTLQLQDNNSNPLGLAKIGNFGGTSDHTMSFGGADDLWSGFANYTVTNSSNFGVIISAAGPGTTFSLDAVQITVYTSPQSTASPAGSGSFDATTGYQYVYEYSNGSAPFGSGAFSNATTPSITTGAFASKENVEVTVVASTDPQVNQLWLFRTTDGGSIYYALPTNPYPNTTTTITDDIADADLITTQLAATAYQNTVTPVGTQDPVFHMGRIWIHVGNVVYYSSGPDLGNILGNGNEGFPPANNFVFPSLVIKKVPTSVGLLIFTISDVYIIYGNGSAVAALAGTNGINLFYAAPFLAHRGISSPFALEIQGTTIYMMTSDNEVISLDPNSADSEIGYPIGAPNFAYPSAESLASFNPAGTYVTWHVSGSDRALYVSDGLTGWFRCNPNLPPDGASTGPVWSPKANITGGCKAVQSIETAPGVWQLLIGPSTGGGNILYRNIGVFTDNAVAYPANFIMGSIVLAQPGQLAEIAFITCDFNKTGTSPTLKILLNEVSGTFEDLSGYVHQDPPSLYGTTLSPNTLYANRYEALQTVTANSGQAPLGAFCRHLQIQIDFGETDTAQNELLDLTIFGAFYTEK